ncbi:unnamed protein product [Coregonus sp. 'balchen']|nr:unnamed protein product [Coregonus sp. 'balchen']
MTDVQRKLVRILNLVVKLRLIIAVNCNQPPQTALWVMTKVLNQNPGEERWVQLQGILEVDMRRKNMERVRCIDIVIFMMRGRETELEMSMEPKGSASGDEKEGEQMEKENFQTEEDTENIEETGERLDWEMGTVEGSGVETLEESLMLLEPEHRANGESNGMDEESLIEPTPFDKDIDSFGIADQFYNQEKGNRVTVETANTET